MLLHRIKEEGIELLNLKICDLRGRWQQLTLNADLLEAEHFRHGLVLDLAGALGSDAWADSEVAVVPDPGTAWIDPFCNPRALSLIGTIHHPSGEGAHGLCPRALAGRAIDALLRSGLADQVRFSVAPRFVLLGEGPGLGVASGGVLELGGEILLTLRSMGVELETHRTLDRDNLQALVTRPADLIAAADALMSCRYVIHRLTRRHGGRATFMPSPPACPPTAGMPISQSLWKGGHALFYGEGTYAHLSQTARWYIGGLLAHAPSLLAWTRPSTNSYRGSDPAAGPARPLGYGCRSAAAVVRIPPDGADPGRQRLIFRAADGLANPYLAFAAMLSAGLDGIRRQLDPGGGVDGPLNGDGDPDEAGQKRDRRQSCAASGLPSDLGSALDALEADRAYLLEGGVFGEDLIEAWIATKRAEIQDVQRRAHPHEVALHGGD